MAGVEGLQKPRQNKGLSWILSHKSPSEYGGNPDALSHSEALLRAAAFQLPRLEDRAAIRPFVERDMERARG